METTMAPIDPTKLSPEIRALPKIEVPDRGAPMIMIIGIFLESFELKILIP